MATVLYGAPVCAQICESCAERSRTLRARGIEPTLAIFRIGHDTAAVDYEQSIRRRAEACGVCVRITELAETEREETIFSTFAELCADSAVHGILLSLPLPKAQKHLTDRLCEMLPAEKDADGVSPLSLGRLYAGQPHFAPCTAEACLRLLDAYGIEVFGKHAAVVGCSVVVGKPLAALLLARKATVTVCHRQTKALAGLCRNADLIFSAAGTAGLITAAFVRAESAVVDVGINWDEIHHKLVGDVDFPAVEAVASAVTPVPGGVGMVTAAVLLEHVISAAGG